MEESKIKIKDIELNNTVRSAILNVTTYFGLKKIPVDENLYNICELVRRKLQVDGVEAAIKLDENGKYMVYIKAKPSIEWVNMELKVKE